ncbi:MAG: hypothetical protein ACREOC_00260 [Gemmatimonadales bacterium]
MGGTGLLIYGTLAPERLVPRPLPRTLFDRLLGRTRHVAPKVTPHGGGAERIQLDAAELGPLIPRFRDFLARKLSRPNEASHQVLEYLELKNIPSLYLRGEREPGQEPEWYTQLGFSGCAGMAEVSALVACHWAAAWVQDELPAVGRDIFTPFGFAPTPGQTFAESDLFLPVAELGYLRYVPADEREEDGLVFEVDYALQEAVEDADQRVADASARHAGLMTDGRCRCQLCAPEFAPLT